MNQNIITFPKSKIALTKEEQYALELVDTVKTISRLGKQIGRPDLICELFVGLISITSKIENDAADTILRIPDYVECAVDKVAHKTGQIIDITTAKPKRAKK